MADPLVNFEKRYKEARQQERRRQMTHFGAGNPFDRFDEEQAPFGTGRRKEEDRPQPSLPSPDEAEQQAPASEPAITQPPEQEKPAVKADEVITTGDVVSRMKKEGTLGAMGDSWGMMNARQKKEWATSTVEEAQAEKRIQENHLRQLDERTRSKMNRYGFSDQHVDRLREKVKSRVDDADKRIRFVESGKRPEKTALRAGVEEVGKGLIGDVIGRIVEAPGIAAGFAGREMGFEITPDDNMVKDLGERIVSFAEEQFPGDEARQHEFAQKLARGAGNMIGFYGPAALPRLLNMGRAAMTATVAGTGANVGSATQFEAATQARLAGEQVSEGERLAAFLWGGALGTTEAVPFAGLISRPAKGFSGVLSAGAANAVEEAAQEGFQTFGENLLARELYDPDRDPAAGLAEGMLIGSILGFGAGTAGGAISALRGDQEASTAPAQDGQPEAPDQPEAMTVDIVDLVQREVDRQAEQDPSLRDPDAINLAPIDIPPTEEAQPEAAAEAPQEAAQTVSEEAAARTPRRRARRSARPQSLVSFIRGLGGVQPTGELRAMDAGRLPGLINSDGMTLDNLREALVEEGFLVEPDPEGEAITTEQDALDLIDRALRGERVVPVAQGADEAEFQAREQARTDLEASRDIINDELAEQGFEDTFDDLSETEQTELLEARARGEDLGDALEQIAIRSISDAEIENPAVREELETDPIPGFDDDAVIRDGLERAGEEAGAAEPAPGEQPGGQERTGEAGEALAEDGETRAAVSEGVSRVRSILELAVRRGLTPEQTGQIRTILEKQAPELVGSFQQLVDDAEQRRQEQTQAQEQARAEFTTVLREALQGVQSSRSDGQPFTGGQIAIADAYRAFVANTGSKVSLDNFKEQLKVASRGRDPGFYLSRLDLPSLMDDELRRESATTTRGGDQVHFINLTEAREKVEPSLDEQPTEETEAESELRRQFVDVIDSQLPRSQWTERLGISEAELEPLIEEQIAAGRLRRVKGGKVWRVPHNQRPDVAASAIPANAPDVIPGEGPVALTDEAQASRDRLQGAVNRAAQQILPRAVSIRFMENINTAVRQRRDQMLAASRGVIPLRPGIGQDAEIVTDRPAHARTFTDARLALDRAGGFSIDGLYDDYQQWSRETGFVPMPREAFGELVEPMLRELGAEPFMLAGKVRYPVTIRPQDEMLALRGVHSTTRDFDRFDPEFFGRADAGYWGRGVYMFPREYAERFGAASGWGISYGSPNTTAAMRNLLLKVDAKNPFYIDTEDLGLQGRLPADWDTLKEHGWPYEAAPVQVWQRPENYGVELDSLRDANLDEIAERARVEFREINARLGELEERAVELLSREPEEFVSLWGAAQLAELIPSAPAERRAELERIYGEWAPLEEMADQAQQRAANAKEDAMPQARLASQFTDALLSAGYDAVILRKDGEPYEMVAIKPGTVTAEFTGDEMFALPRRSGRIATDEETAGNLGERGEAAFDGAEDIIPVPQGKAAADRRPADEASPPPWVGRRLTDPITGTRYSKRQALSETLDLQGRISKAQQAGDEGTVELLQHRLDSLNDLVERFHVPRGELRGGEEGQFRPSRIIESGDFVVAVNQDSRLGAVPELGGATYRIYRRPSDKPLSEISRPSRELGGLLGYADLKQKQHGPPESKGWEVAFVEVRPRARRQGVQKALYKAIQDDLDIIMNPSGVLFEDGYQSWKKRDPERVKHHQKVGSYWLSPRQIKASIDEAEARIAAFDFEERVDNEKEYLLSTFLQSVVSRYVDETGIDRDVFLSGDEEAIFNALKDVHFGRAIRNPETFETYIKSREDAARVIAQEMANIENLAEQDARDAVQNALEAYERERDLYQEAWDKIPEEAKTQSALDEMFSLRGFYSPAIRAAETLKQNKGTGEQFWKQITKAPNVRKDELEWMGLEEWLSDKKSVTRDEVLDFMNAHRVELDERILGEDARLPQTETTSISVEEFRRRVQRDEDEVPDGAYDEIWAFNRGRGQAYVAKVAGEDRYWVLDNQGEAHTDTESFDEAQHLATGILTVFEDEEGSPRFEQFKVPGGENYREILIRMPELEGRFESPHFHDQEIVHIRADDREGPDGGRVLFINEIQSDLLQKARPFGFGEEGYAKAQAVIDARKERYETTAEGVGDFDEFIRRYSELTDQRQEELERKAFAYIDLFGPQGAPEVPFTNDRAVEIALKRALLYAAENGYDAVSWARSDQIAKAVGAEQEDLALQYDKKIPKFLDKYTKKWGGKVERFRLPEAGDEAAALDAYARQAGYNDFDDLVDALEGSREQLRQDAIANDALEFGFEGSNPILRITDEMRASVMEGQPMALRGGNIPQTLTPEFREWFGNSRVVDEEGRPLVVYHGGASGLEIFTNPAVRAAEFLTPEARERLVDVSFFARDQRVARTYQQRIDEQAFREGDDTGEVYPVYLSIQNPFEIDMRGQSYDPGQVEEVIEQAKAAGHDGLIVRNVVDDYYQQQKPTTVYATFEPTQIKSATQNIGTFDPTDPRINRAMRQGQPEPLGQTDPYNMTVSIGMQAVEAEAQARGVAPEQEGVRVLRHEAVEFFRAMGIFSDQEWQLLTETARKQGWIESTGVRDAYEQYYGGRMSDAELSDLLTKEAIAEQYSEFHLGRKQFDSAIQRLFQRIKDFLTRVANFVRGEGFQTWEDVFERIDEGEFRQRFDRAFPELAQMRQRQEAGDTAPAAPGQQQTGGVAPSAISGQQSQLQPTGQVATGIERPSMGLSELVDEANRTLGLTTRQGRLDPTARRQASQAGAELRGQTSRETGVVRLKFHNDIETLTHEGGHALEDQFGAELEAIKRQFEGELRPLSSESAMGDPLSEAFANWFKRYALNRRAAENTAPGFLAAFEDFLDARDPAMLQRLQQIESGVQEWIHSSPSGKITQSIKSMVQEGRVKEVVREFQEEGLKNSFTNWTNRAYTALWDDLHPIRMAVDHLLQVASKNLDVNLNDGERLGVKAANDAYKIMRLARDGYSAGHMNLLYGVHAYHATEPEGPSLREAMATAFEGAPPSAGLGRAAKFAAGIPDDGQWSQEMQDNFDSYLVSRNFIIKWQKFLAGETTVFPDKFTLEEHRQNVAEMEARFPQFVEAAQLVYQFNRNLLKLQLDAGILPGGQETYDKLIQEPDYVPVHRDMGRRSFFGMSSLRGQNKQSIIKRFRGSQRDVISPLESIAKNTYETAMFIARNDAVKALDALARAAGPGGGAIAERIPAHEMKATQVNAVEALRNAARDAGIDEADALAMIQTVEDQIGDNQVTNLWRMGEISEKNEPIVYLWENGERIPIRLPDGEFGQMLFEAVTALPGPQQNMLVNILALPATVVRVGVTTAFDFIGANFIRDQMTAWALTRDFVPFVDGARGIYDDLKVKDISRLYSLAGGLFGGINVGLQHETRIKRDVRALRHRGINMRINKARDLWKLTEISETGTRLAVMRKSMNRAKADGLADYDAMLEAAYAARDYIDFGRRGSKTHSARRIIPFFNAAMQGLDRYVRAMRGRVDDDHAVRDAITPYLKSRTGQPLSVKERRQLSLSAKAWAATATIGVLGVLQSLLYKDDPEYEEIGEYIRATHWVFKVDGVWYRVPKPFEIAWMSNIFERTFEYTYKDDPVALERMVRGLFEITVPPHSIPGIEVVTELRANYDFFRDRPITGQHLKRLPPHLQYNAYASEFGKFVGEQLGVSPAYVDHFVTGFGASWGREWLNTSDHLFPLLRGEEGPESSVHDYFFMRRFTKDHTRGSTSVMKFWDLMSFAGGKFTQAASGYRHYLEKAADPKAASDFLKGLSREERAYALLEASKRGRRDAKLRKLHPLNRAEAITTVANRIRKQMNLDRLESSITQERIQVSPTEHRMAREILRDIAMREARNALVALGVRGWAQKEPMRVDTLMDELEEAVPNVHREYMRRIRKQKLPSYEDVRENWPEARDRLLREEENAIIRDLYIPEPL